MRLIRRWPKWRRRGIIARRNYRKVYWYCLEFKDEFVNEIIRPRADRDENPLSQYPLYYRGYLFVRAIPRGLKVYAAGIKDDYAKWVAFRDNSQLGFKKISNEIREIHADNKSSYKLWFSIAIRLFRDSMTQFLKGYNEAMSGKQFPSEEAADGKTDGKSEKEKKE